jgi:rhamnogalacturonan endolyase
MTMKITRREMMQGALAAMPAVYLMPKSFALPAQDGMGANGTVLLQDDFSKLPTGWLTYPVGVQGPAIQENQWIDSRARPFGVWSNGVADQDAWLVSQEGATGKYYMMQGWSHPPHGVSAVLVAGEGEWADYTYEALVKPLALDGIAGIAFRYQSNLQYYVLGLTGGNKVQINVQHLITEKFRLPNWETVASAPFEYNTEKYYLLKVENQGNNIRAYIDGNKVLEASNAIYAGGKVGLCSDIPARFQDVRVEASAPVKQEIVGQIQKRNAKLASLQADNPKPRLWKKFSVDGFGTASDIKFGDLDGDGVPELVIAQNIQTISRDAYDIISCLTAINVDGKILWQSGKPNPRNGMLTNDNPFQVHDVDGDGHAEVVTIRDFQIQILDGKTGKVKKWAWMPKAPELPTKHAESVMRPYDLVLGDSLFFVNVSGNKDRHEILVKDRYLNFWIYNNNLELLWKGAGQNGHCPYVFDVDGYDRIMIGYAMWDHTGKKLWSHDEDLKDHADSIAVVNFSGNPSEQPRVYSTGSDEGFLMFSYDGKLMKQLMVGHAQASSVGKYRMDLPGLQFMMVDFHWNPGVMLLFDWEGNILQTAEPVHNGSKMLPVNWRGDGEEFVLLSGDAKYGGMINGRFERAVMFPDDGHPDLASFVLDMTGDGRDEVVLWDEKSVWIYTQDRPFKGEKLYTPIRNPLYNTSNYSCIVSLPDWKNVAPGGRNKA